MVLFIQIQTLPPSMHHKWKGIIDIACKETNGKDPLNNSAGKYMHFVRGMS